MSDKKLNEASERFKEIAELYKKNDAKYEELIDDFNDDFTHYYIEEEKDLLILNFVDDNNRIAPVKFIRRNK